MKENNNLEFLKPILVLSFILTLLLIFSLFVLNEEHGYSCKIKTKSNPELYCSQNWECYPKYSNVTNDCYQKWFIGNHTEDEIKKINHENLQKQKAEAEAKRVECYNNGEDFSASFDIKKDYGLSCSQIGYINNHLIDNYAQVDGGYTRGSYSGFLSSGHSEGKFYDYINERIVATGQLVQNISYHTDCEGNKHNEIIDYYSEEEFVMYYVQECLG